MKAIILAAGRSRRLFPITHRRPKCLLSVNNNKIIDRLITSLKNNKIIEIVVVTGFRANILEDYLYTHHPDIHFTFIRNEEYATTNAGYSFWLARAHLNKDIIYLNSDVLCEEQLIRDVVKDARDSVTAIKHSGNDPEEVNVVLNQDDTVREIGKHIKGEESEGEFIGITKLSKEFNVYLSAALKHFYENNERNKFAADAINHAIQHGAVLYAADMSMYNAREIDTIEDYEEAKKQVRF